MYVIKCIGFKRKFSIITSFHPQIFNGSEERNAGRERGGKEGVHGEEEEALQEKGRVHREEWVTGGVDMAEQV